MTAYSCQVIGCGAWGDGFNSWDELKTILNGTDSPREGSKESTKGPKPSIIPANERRRAPLPVRLAVETSAQACEAAKIDPKSLACVFASGFGDTQLTDYMCKVLASDNKQLSPTKFHNSVHNAAAGYWTISTGCNQAANSVAGFQQTVSAALLETVIQCLVEQRSLLLTFFDAPVTPILHEVMGPGTSFGCSLILAPSDHQTEGRKLSLTVEEGKKDWQQFSNENALLQQHYQSNPSGRLLPLLSDLAKTTEKSEQTDTHCLPLSANTHLKISL